MGQKSKQPDELYLTRLYNYPVKMVWDAWTDVEQAKHWWGPRGFTITNISKDFRPGGKWKYTMHGPDGVDYPNISTYHEIIPYKKMVYDHGGNEERQKLFTVTVIFTPVEDKTLMEFTMKFDSPEQAKEIGKFIKLAGGNATWDRLGEYLDKEDSGKEIFLINRTFNAGINTLFDMFTKPEHFSKWLPPTGFDMTYLKSDIKEGSSTLYMMKNAEGFTMYNTATYLEIKRPTKLVYTQSFCDEKGNITKAPFDMDWPRTMKTTIVFAEEDTDQTRVTATWELVGDYTQSELQTFIKERPGMTVGWTGSFDKLEDLLSK